MPTWHAYMPALNERLETLEDADLRMLLVLTQCYWNLGRIQGIQEAMRDMQNGENNGE